MQYLFMVETNKKNDSDRLYIWALINHLYDIRGDKLTPVYMNTKTRYNQCEDKVSKEIRRYGSLEDTKVFLCIDLDVINNDNTGLNEKIIEYAKDNNYELIWFYEDVELAFLGHKVDDKEKNKKAVEFYTRNKITSVKLSKLSKNNMTLEKNTSNIVTILDKYLKRK